MEVIKIKPYGFCAGVASAISIAKKAKEENPNKKIYMLGMLVHNEDVINSFLSEGFIILDEHKDTLENLLNSVDDESVIIFSAHGHPKKLEEIALKKKLIIYDSTCKFVKDNLDTGRKTKDIIYIGLSNHLESDAFIKENPHCSFYDVNSNKWDCSSIKVDNPKILSQTTLSYLEVENAIKRIKEVFPKSSIIAERCSSTSLRQKSLLDVSNNVDCYIVLGSKTSNNTVKLAQIASKTHNKEVFICQNLDDVKLLDLKQIKKVALCSGASTSRETFEQVATYLETLN